MSESKKSGRWKPGQCGNPRGKPPGSGEIRRPRAAIIEHVPDILNRLVCVALVGDVRAAQLLLERVMPPIKAIEQCQGINLPDGTLTEQGRAVLAAVAAGELAPGQGAQLLAAIGALARVVEIDELSARVAALEASHAAT